ncbi:MULTISPECIES: nitrilase-related carbon-nitrogen hydrolase [Arthrobacter]|uniref:nitrilase-related carbon-nitrogen hydrolase n=1 Tax=Arthrobacter TaxID=1663 RepID=UPI001EF023CA|nr:MULTISPECIES: nitrilase-related carbon-nitrogen hydrolase [Arthrobacter]MDP9986732.1 putative amidohydrolase [Arthrobacter oryzae]UKA72379.1 nitrilase [Arthrobacter sp. FW306-06-A]UKA76611.1 nitrilase [Arthrobacter sp. FW306-07-I]
MLLSVLQANAAVLDVEANLRTVDDAARRAATAGADLLLTPELFPVGYAPLRLRSELDPASLPAIRAQLADIARRNGIALVYSLPSVAGGEAGASAQGRDWHISATLVDATGTELLSYAKVHLFGGEERKAFVAAAEPPAVVTFKGVRTSLLICYDIEFPEAARAAAARGAELLLVPTALSIGFDAVPQVLIRARALESQLNVAYANHCGIEDAYSFGGGSVVAGPDGAVLASGGGGPELLFAQVGTETVHAAREEVPYMRERRPELYREWEGRLAEGADTADGA